MRYLSRTGRRSLVSRTLVVPEVLESRLLMAEVWQNVQIGGGGYVTGLAASGDGSGIYMRTDVGGAYRWNAAAGAWNPITESLPPDFNNGGHLYGISAIAVDPGNEYLHPPPHLHRPPRPS